MNRMRSSVTAVSPLGFLPLLGLVALSGCRTSSEVEHASIGEDSAGRGHDATPFLPPMDVTGTVDTRWDYLLGKYDQDGDDRVAATEYDRGDVAFARLDRDDDGYLTSVDFASGPSREERMTEMRAERTLGRYFQDESDATELTLAELEAAFGAYDADDNELLIRPEFDARYEGARVTLAQDDSRMIQRMMGDVEPWDALVALGDTDGDECLAVEEITALFARFDEENTGKLSWVPPAPREERASGSSRPEGPDEGTLAPDFTLEPPDGGGAVTLSSFKGSKPVALIFGSYT
ncbi:MAG: hypothetical protein E2O39_00445 [Planctomycetota bacterium]|nr:MAG: hypothetical protein E2O39_00445 [Planctomycetota bacterium]